MSAAVSVKLCRKWECDLRKKNTISIQQQDNDNVYFKCFVKAKIKHNLSFPCKD